jgi:membrane protease subunit (stomatin/prohibitin family)
MIEFTNMPWGLKNPIIVNDDRFGMIELRGFGTYAFKFADPKQFFVKFNSADNEFTTDQIKDQLRSLVVMQMSDKLGEAAIPVEKLAANMSELSELLLQVLNPVFEKDYGLTLTKFYIENLSMPDEVKKEIMELSRLDKVDLDKLAKMKFAKSLENGGGSGNASDMMGMMMGMNMANQMMNNQNNQNKQTNMPPPPPLVSFYVAVNGQQTGPFDMAALSQQVQAGSLKKESLVWKNGMAAWAQAGSVPDLAELFMNVPPPLPPPIG